MHIMEGYLPATHAIGWWAITVPFLVTGAHKLKHIIKTKPTARMLLGAAAAFVFVLSAMKMPSVTGSCSHPTGTGLGAMLFGPGVMAILGIIVLLFQALLLAHGGLTTLGANAFSMAIAGPWAAYGAYTLLKRFGTTRAIFAGAAIGSMVTYIMAALQLGLAFPDPASGIIGATVKFLSIFAITQIPLAIAEGILTVLIFNAIKAHSPEELRVLNIIREEGAYSA